MRGHTDDSVPGASGDRSCRVGMQAQKAVGIVAKPPLTSIELAPVTSAELIIHRQQGQTDPGMFCGSHYPFGHFRKVCIGPAAHVMVQVMKFSDCAIA